MEHFRKHYGKWKKLVQKKKYILYDVIYVKTQNRQHLAMLTEILSVVV